MPKNILVIVEAPAKAAPIVDAATALALAHEACLDIAVLTPGPVASPALVPFGAMYLPDEVVARDSRANVAAVEALVAGASCPVAVFGLYDDVAWLAGDLRRSRQIADLTVIGTPEAWELHWLRRRVVETLILSSGTPILILPPDHRIVRVRHAVFGWKPSPEAIRTLHDLVRLLEPEARVDIVMVSERPRQAGDDNGAEVKRHLTRHGFVAELRPQFARPMMRTVTCLERDYAGRLCREEVEQLGSRQLAAEDHRTTLVGATPSASIELCVSGRMSGGL